MSQQSVDRVLEHCRGLPGVTEDVLPDEELITLIEQSYALVSEKLSKKLRASSRRAPRRLVAARELVP